MKKLFLKKISSPTLLIFFAGWGMDYNPFSRYFPDGKDLLICYDYTSFDWEEDVAGVLQTYSRVDVLAWSMGVWAASRILPSDLPSGERIAVNGTPWPVDDRFGIPESIFRGTMEHLDDYNLRKFRLRMCGGIEALSRFENAAPMRTTDDLYGELAAIDAQLTVATTDSFIWDKAVIGVRDRIFPPDNQCQAWRRAGIETALVDAAHYSESLFANLIEKWLIKV